MKKTILITLAILFLFLPACSGGGSSDNKTTHPAAAANGLWFGSVYEAGYGHVEVAVIINDGLAVGIYSNGVMFNGTISVSGKKITGVGTSHEFHSGDPTANGAISGTLNPGKDISLEFVTSYHTYGLAGLTYSPTYDRGASISKIAGVWGSYVPGLGATRLVIAADGSITGFTADGADVIGDVDIPDPSKNVYHLYVTLRGTGVPTGNYEGLAWITDDNAVAVGLYNSRHMRADMLFRL